MPEVRRCGLGLCTEGLGRGGGWDSVREPLAELLLLLVVVQCLQVGRRRRREIVERDQRRSLGSSVSRRLRGCR